ncbi:MAG: ABC transporter permease [Dehalococcoidia bacterium]|nr:ABC transporter permease [Dehalococcoidia bacterium]
MDLVIDSFLTALNLIFAGDREVFSITGRTLLISSASTSIAALIFVPVGSLIYFHNFPGKGLLINIIQTLFSMPTVFVGLLVFITFSREGPLGGFGILFSPTAIVIGHVVLISPIMTGLTISALRGIPPEIQDTAMSLGASRLQTIYTIVREARYGVSTAVLLGFGRAISEIGLAIIVGGNINGYTRTLTTAMSLEASIGNFELAIALGIILVSLALAVNILVSRLQHR